MRLLLSLFACLLTEMDRAQYASSAAYSHQPVELDVSVQP